MREPVVLALTLGLAALTARAQDPDREADHAQLRQMLHKVKAAVNDNRLETLVPLLDRDFSLIMLDQAVITEPAGVAAYFKKHFEGPGAVLSSIRIEPEADILTQFLGDDVGVNRGTSKDTYTLKTGTQVVMHTRWSGTFRQVDGQWKVVNLHVGANVLDNPILGFAARGRQMWGAGGLVLGVLLGSVVGVVLGRRRGRRRE